MAITWDEMVAKIDLDLDILNPFLLVLTAGRPNIDISNFSETVKEEIHLSLKLIFESSEIARDTLSNYFENNNQLNIVRNADGKGSLHIPTYDTLFISDVIFIDLKDVGANYLNLTGSLSQASLGFIVYHEFLHAYDAWENTPVPPVEDGQRDFADPNFDHLGSVVRRTNDVVEEVLAKLSDPVFVSDFSSRLGSVELQGLLPGVIESFQKDGLRGSYYLFPEGEDDRNNIKNLVDSGLIDGEYDQSILLETGGAITTFNSDGTNIDNHPSRDLVISLHESRDIKTGNGDDVVVGGEKADTIHAGGGNDKIIHTGGADTVNGGDDFDTFIIRGSFSDYEFSSNISGEIGLTDISTGDRSVLVNIERIQFADALTDQFGNPIHSVNQGINLISGLGGSAGFGEQLLARNDDGSTGFIDITSIFEDNVNFFGREFSGLWVNNNGSVTFNGPRGAYTPNVITSISGNPEITPFFADVDTGGGQVSPTPGGNSTGSNLVYYDFDAVNDRFIATWDDVGYFSNHTDKLNAFQLILTDRGSGDFDIEFRYEDVNWTTGDFSGGSGGLGGSVARAGYTAGTGNPAAFFELPASGNQNAMLALDETAGNTGDIGRWEFKVRSGNVVTSDIPPLPPIRWTGWTKGDPHIVTMDGVGYDFQAAGEFVMLRGVSDPSFEIQARMVPIGRNVSVNSAVATNLGGVAVMVDAQDAVPLHIDGIATTLNNFSFINVGNDRIFREDNTYTIVYAGADGVVNAGDSRMAVDVFSNRVDIQVHLNSELAGDVEGIMGDADSNPANDIALADGTVLDRPLAFNDLYGQYRDDWRVSDIADSLFTYDSGESLDGFYLPVYPGSLMTLSDLDPAVRAAAEQAALDAGLSRGTANFNNAVLDFALTGDSSFITSAVNTPVISENNVVTITPPPPPPAFNPITGTSVSDYLTGTAAADIIHSLGGSYDKSSGGLGGDIFAFGAEALNGIRERDVILDYEVGIDSILLKDGASVGSIRQTSTGVTVFLQGDGDAIYVQGVGVLPGNLTFAPENIVIA